MSLYFGVSILSIVYEIGSSLGPAIFKYFRCVIQQILAWVY